MKKMLLSLKNCLQKNVSFLGLYQNRKFGSFDEALRNTGSYENCDIIRIVSLKTQILVESIEKGLFKQLNDRQIIQNLLVLSFVAQKKPMKVIEIGGACGATFFLIHHYAPEFIKTWTIIETDKMVSEAKEKFENNTLKFFSIKDFEKDPYRFSGDVLVAQGVLQYLEDPVFFFETMQKMDFPFIYLSRTSFGENILSPVITRQTTHIYNHGPGAMPNSSIPDQIVSQPRTIIPLGLFKAKISRSYQVVFEFEEGNPETIYLPGEKIKNKEMGMLLKRTCDGAPP